MGQNGKSTFGVITDTRYGRGVRKDGGLVMTTKGYTRSYHIVLGGESFTLIFRRKSL